MLATPAPYPHVGSYALLIDLTNDHRAELVRVQARWNQHRGGAFAVTVAFPNRIGAGGTRNVEETDLIDATPLTRLEERDLTDGLRELRGRDKLSPRLRTIKTRTDALRHRQIYSVIMASELAVLREREARADRHEEATRECIRRRAALRRDLAAEDARLTWLRRRLADQRGLGFIRVEAVEREFGA